MGFGPRGLCVKLRSRTRGRRAESRRAFGATLVVATAMEAGLGVIWLVMDNALRHDRGSQFITAGVGCLFESDARLPHRFSRWRSHGADACSSDRPTRSARARRGSLRPSTVIQARWRTRRRRARAWDSSASIGRQLDPAVTVIATGPAADEGAVCQPSLLVLSGRDHVPRRTVLGIAARLTKT